MNKVDPVLHEKLEKLISAMGYELIGGEMVQEGRQKCFRIYIDSPNGINLDDCTRVSHQVSAMLDVEALIQGDYSLEISSPGINRPLFQLVHYKKAVGEQVKIRLRLPIEGRRQYQGELLSIDGEDICLLVDKAQEIKLPFSAIEKANIIGDVGFQKTEGRG
ncbi:MAG: hypothetical protein A3F14_02675 [Gammaproteobacteria bacterium RIFCSPHIGHO2_12_FULL_43_28]|nr:MAG: hypothetical protein A3F14_02675 [Gammaproteobacteria bacterium RIFCSPHIGHO2_12_FULL_43_28]